MLSFYHHLSSEERAVIMLARNEPFLSKIPEGFTPSLYRANCGVTYGSYFFYRNVFIHHPYCKNLSFCCSSLLEIGILFSM